jgi:hypothetical protein
MDNDYFGEADIEIMRQSLNVTSQNYLPGIKMENVIKNE